MEDKSHPFYRDTLQTPIGLLSVVSDESERLKIVLWDNGGDVERLLKAEFRDAFQLIEKRDAGGFTSKLASYFAGELSAIEGLPVAIAGTAFQKSVWQALLHIPIGTTTSYGKLALKLGVPAAARAVGLANGSNPISIVVPCHRVIGASGALTGYGGGLERKAWLLKHEGCLLL